MGFRKFKPRRGGARRFTPTRELAAQDRKRREEGEESTDSGGESSGEEGESTTNDTEGDESSNSDTDSDAESDKAERSTDKQKVLSQKMASVRVNRDQSSSSSDETPAQTKATSSAPQQRPAPSSTSQKPLGELSRREREAIEKGACSSILPAKEARGRRSETGCNQSKEGRRSEEG